MQPWTDFVQTFPPHKCQQRLLKEEKMFVCLGALGQEAEGIFILFTAQSMLQILRKCVYLLAGNFQACVLAGSRSGDAAVVQQRRIHSLEFFSFLPDCNLLTNWGVLALGSWKTELQPGINLLLMEVTGGYGLLWHLTTCHPALVSSLPNPCHSCNYF